jgi:hypothetical protein
VIPDFICPNCPKHRHCPQDDRHATAIDKLVGLYPIFDVGDFRGGLLGIAMASRPLHRSIKASILHLVVYEKFFRGIIPLLSLSGNKEYNS